MASKATELTNQLIEYENSKKTNQNYNSTPTKNYNVGERIISTPISVFNQIIKGASKGLEGVYDFAANLVGGAAGLFGNKDLQEDISNHTKFNWTDWWYNQTSI